MTILTSSFLSIKIDGVIEDCGRFLGFMKLGIDGGKKKWFVTLGKEKSAI